MKTIKFFLIIVIIAISQQLNAQIKLFSNGYISLGSTTVPTNYKFNISFNNINIGAGNTKPTLGLDLTPSDPRMWSSSNKIVFYNTFTGTYNDIQVRTCYQISDLNAKTNINSMSNSLSSLKKLRGVTFNWKDKDANTKPSQELEYGFIAQEVEKVFPNLVITNDSTKSKMLSYTGIIPILVEAIKELSTQVENQNAKIIELQNAQHKGIQISTNTTNSAVASLNQNSPNPFTQSTVISYCLPEATQKAELNIYNMRAVLIKHILIKSNGNGSVTINGSELQPGMYIYTLIADNQEVDSKRMILTQ